MNVSIVKKFKKVKKLEKISLRPQDFKIFEIFDLIIYYFEKFNIFPSKNHFSIFDPKEI